jgi:ketosteroid isomerase-like protein
MKRLFTIILFIVAMLPVVFGQANGKSSTRESKVVEEIKRMDRQWIIEAYSSKDLKDFDRIVAEDFLITGSNGKVLNKAEKRAVVAADYTEPSPTSDAIFKIEEDSAQVRVFDKTAISTGYIIEKYDYKGNKINARVYFTNVYLKRDGRWQIVAAHFTRIKQA